MTLNTVNVVALLECIPLSHNDCPTSRSFLVPNMIAIWTWLTFELLFCLSQKCLTFGSSTQLEIWGSKSNISAPDFHHQDVFRHRNSGGHCRVVVVVLYSISYNYNYSVNGQHALISPKLGERTIILRRRAYERGVVEDFLGHVPPL